MEKIFTYRAAAVLLVVVADPSLDSLNLCSEKSACAALNLCQLNGRHHWCLCLFLPSGLLIFSLNYVNSLFFSKMSTLAFILSALPT
jgi:hypothetical protein